MRRLLGTVAFLILVVMTLAVLVAGGATWALNTESGLNFVANQGAKWLKNELNQTLLIEEAKGDFWEGAKLGRLSWTDGLTQVELTDLEFKVDFMTLLDQRVWIRRLAADTVTVTLPEAEPKNADDEPFVMPESIVLPVVIELDQLEVGQLRVAGQEVKNVQLEAQWNTRGLQLGLLKAELDTNRLSVQGELGAVRPYALALQADIARQVDKTSFIADLALRGTLDRIEIQADALASQLDAPDVLQRVKATGAIKPFSQNLVESLALSTQGFNPNDWLNQLPVAGLDIDLTMTPNADFSRTSGRLKFNNSLAGGHLENKLPLGGGEADFELVLKENALSSVFLDLRRLRLATESDAAGELSGSVDWVVPASFDDLVNEPGQLNLELTASQVQPALLLEMPFKPLVDVTLKGRIDSEVVKLDTFRVIDRQASLEGEVTLNRQKAGELTGVLGFNNIRIENYQSNSLAQPLIGTVNGKLLVDGLLGSGWMKGKLQPAGVVDFALADTQISSVPVRLKGRLKGDAKRLAEVKLDGDVSGAFIAAKGALGNVDDRIEWQVSAPEISKATSPFGLKAAGALEAKGSLSGDMLHPAIELDLIAKKLEVEGAATLAALTTSLKGGLSPDSKLEGVITLEGLEQPGSDEALIRSAKINLTGSLKEHTLGVAFETGLSPFSRRRVLEGGLVLNGGFLADEKRWVGNLSGSQVEGMWRPVNAFAQKDSAALSIGSDGVLLSNFVLSGADGSLITSEMVKLRGEESFIAGTAKGLTMPRVRSLTATLVSLETKFLVTDIVWRIESNPKDLKGHLDLKRTSGGFAILEDSEIDVPINDLSMAVDFTREAVSAELNVDAPGAGVITANARLPVYKNLETNSWGLATDLPIEAAFAAGLTDLKWLGPLASPTLRTAGSGQVSLVVGGTLDNPLAEGIAFARELDILELNQGVRLEDGSATVFFNNDRIEIREAEFAVYNRNVPRRRLEELAELIQGAGKVSLNGEWYINGTSGEVNLKLDKVGLLQRSDRWLMVDGELSALQPDLPDEPIVVRGEVTALGAYVEVPESGPDTLGSDVVLRGRQGTAGAESPLDLKLVAKLGDKFYLNAQGLRTRLDGQMQLDLQQGVQTVAGRTGSRLSANGTIQTLDGTYRAYGQDLTIERGVVNFQGSLANPGLNIRAVRKGVAVEAGVEVTGSAQRPQVTLVSDPPVPDSEKLSWMIIGRGSDSSDRDASLLLTAATALFGDADEDSATEKIAKAVGIDDFALTSGSLTAADSRAVGSQVSVAPGADPSAAILGEDDPLLTQRIITLGKTLNKDFTLFFEQSVTTAANIVKLNYQYSRNLSVILRGGADNAVDVLYQFSFD